MNVTLLAVGRPSRLLADAIAEYEARAGRYWKLDVVEVSAARAAKNQPVTAVRQAEGEKLRAALPSDTAVVALTRTGSPWSSRDLARYLNQLAVGGTAGATFVIGGAYGLDRDVVKNAAHRVSLSGMTMPHELARLVLAEQLYRAGTIVRGEPYHKG